MLELHVFELDPLVASSIGEVEIVVASAPY